jgi:hypothetical protein
MEIVEVLRSDFGDLDVVDVHFLLFDEVEQEVERTFVHGDGDFVGGGHWSVISYQFSVLSKAQKRIADIGVARGGRQDARVVEILRFAQDDIGTVTVATALTPREGPQA